MEMPTIGLSIFIFSLTLIFVLLTHRDRQKDSLIDEKKTQFKNLYKREAVYLCDSAEDLGDNLIQFYGEPFGTSIRPGMKISDGGGSEYLIKEVYADDENPEEPDPEIPNRMPKSAIVIETKNFDWQNLRMNLKRDGIVAFKVR